MYLHFIYLHSERCFCFSILFFTTQHAQIAVRTGISTEDTIPSTNFWDRSNTHQSLYSTKGIHVVLGSSVLSFVVVYEIGTRPCLPTHVWWEGYKISEEPLNPHKTFCSQSRCPYSSTFTITQCLIFPFQCSCYL